MGHDAVVSVRSLTKKFGTLTAVDAVSMVLNKGDIYALIGPNGAGKTTLVKMLVGLYRPTNGTVRLCGQDIVAEPLEAKRMFGYVPDDPLSYAYLTGREFLELTGRLRGLKGSSLTEKIRQVSGIFPVGEFLGLPMSAYSRGNRQKVAILAAVMADPQILIIDEPVVGLDPGSITILTRLLKDFARKGGTVLFVTHILPFARLTANRFGLMKNGKLVHDGVLHGKTDLEKLTEAD